MFGTIIFIIGFSLWQPLIITKDGDEPIKKDFWSFPVKYLKPIFNFYYQHYGIIGSLYLAYIAFVILSILCLCFKYSL